MPATLFSDLEFSTSHHGGNKVIEDTRALQVALELSMLYMNGEQRQQQQQQHKSDAPSSLSGGQAMVDSSTSSSSSLAQSYIPNGFPEEPRNKKSQNMTECVPVPSSEHVAEIVGRQGNTHAIRIYIMFFLLEYYVSVGKIIIVPFISGTGGRVFRDRHSYRARDGVPHIVASSGISVTILAHLPVRSVCPGRFH